RREAADSALRGHPQQVQPGQEYEVAGAGEAAHRADRSAVRGLAQGLDRLPEGERPRCVAAGAAEGGEALMKAIRDHLRDVIPIIGLLVVGILATYIIVQNQRLRIPLLEEKPFELKADMSTAQAVTPGQGQTVRVAGVRVGDISNVDYENGHAVVTMAIDRKFLPASRHGTD